MVCKINETINLKKHMYSVTINIISKVIAYIKPHRRDTKMLGQSQQYIVISKRYYGENVGNHIILSD